MKKSTEQTLFNYGLNIFEWHTFPATLLDYRTLRLVLQIPLVRQQIEQNVEQTNVGRDQQKDAAMSYDPILQSDFDQF